MRFGGLCSDGLVGQCSTWTTEYRVSPMSSGLCKCGWLGVGAEGSIGDIGESAFEESEGFSFG